MTIDYHALNKEDFDAIVTGELTHYAIWIESSLNEIISDYFAQASKHNDFERLLLHREGLTLQDKIEIVRSILPLIKKPKVGEQMKSLLGEIENFKVNRNALAHGFDVTPSEIKNLSIHVEIVRRNGKKKVIIITPESHEATMSKAETLLKNLMILREKMRS